MSSRIFDFEHINGAKHSPPGVIIVKSEGPHATGGMTPFHQVSHCEIVFKSIILDSRYNDFRRRFYLCPPQVLNHTTDGGLPPQFCEILENLEQMDFLKSCFVKSRGVTRHPW